MAFSFFGKKDKNPTEATAPVAKAPPTPPKIQTPPGVANIPTVKPPQPSGLIPTSGMTSGAATTQPMVMPRTASGLKPTRPGVVQSTRSTQRIVLPGGLGKPTSSTKSLPIPAAAAPAGRINLPVGMILRCLPPEVLAADIAQFEAAGTAATEIGLPMNMILSQLPSGKVEMTLADLVPHFPPGYLQPTASITNYLPTVVNLPLMDVVMRIPPDLLALRPDQKGVDASVINMADPFTEEILREQAEAARRQTTQNNIIEESQVPQSEAFVPTAAPKTIAPPQRPTAPGIVSSVSASGQLPPPPKPPSRLPGSVAPASPSVSARTISPSGTLPAPTRATAAIPARPQAAVTSQMQAPMLPQPTAPIPMASTPRSMVSMPPAPIPPVPRLTQSLPKPQMPPVQPEAPPQPAPRPTPAPMVAEAPPAPVEAPVPEELAATSPVEQPAPGVPDAAADDLQRLAALAMAQMGESEEPESASTDLLATAETAPIANPEPEAYTPPVQEETLPIPVAAPEPEPEPEPVAYTPPEPVEEPAPIETPAPVAFTPPPLIQPPAPVFTPAPLPIAPAPVATAPVRSIPVAVPTPVAAPAPVAYTPPPTPAVQAPTSIVNPEAVLTKPLPTTAEKEPTPEESGAFNLNTCTVEELLQIPGCNRELAESIIKHRKAIGSFQRIEDLLDVPGITKDAYTNLTGETPPANRIPLTINELLGFPADQRPSLKEVTDRICCWPDVTGCVLSQGSGLSLVGHTPKGLDKAALVAFVPRMFESLNKSFSEIAGKETNDLIIPTAGTSYHIFRDNDLYLIILCRLPQMPERHLKVARFVLAALSMRKE